MATNKRTPFERERDLDLISRYYRERKTQAEIAVLVKLSRQQVAYDLKTIHERWLESSLVNRQAYIAGELARIDHLERKYWDAYEKSCGERVVTRTEKTDGEAGRNKASRRVEQRDGDPRWLWGVQWCIERRLKLLLPKEQKDEENDLRGYAEKMLGQEDIRKLLEESKVYEPSPLTITSPVAEQA